MTLVRELLKPDSAISGFIRDTFPGRGAVVAGWRERVEGRFCPSYRLKWGESELLGSALELQLAFDLAERPPYEDMFLRLTNGEMRRALTAAGYTTPTHLDSVDGVGFDMWERTAPNASFAEHWVHELFYLVASAQAMAASHPEPTAEYRRDTAMCWRFAAGVASPGWLDAQAHLWEIYDRAGRPQLQALGPMRHVRPVFDSAFAIGDYVMGNTLVEAKAYANPVPALSTWLGQCLGYVLLDAEDTFQLRDVAVYDAWRGVLLRASLDDLDVPADKKFLDRVRAQFREVAELEVKKSRFYKYGTTEPHDQRWKRNSD
ncbi:MAG: hypothetical protein ACRD3Q_22220 [Terriglobales bacterium]